MQLQKSTEETNALIEKSRKKIQALLNYGFEFQSSYNTKQTDSHQIAKAIQDDETFTLKMSSENSMCIKVSDMVLKLLKPYLKDILYVGQISKGYYILFSRDDDIIQKLEPLLEANEDMQLVDAFALCFNKGTMPSYKNTANLYTVTKAPVLKEKEVKKILELHKKVVENKDNYFLLSNNISHAYNMGMSLLRILGTNVISLKALNVCEVILWNGRTNNGRKPS